jgi:hypothetical protein
VNAQGTFSGTALDPNLGPNTFEVEVSDGEFKPTTLVKVNVLNRAPVWTNKPVNLPNAKEDAVYTQNLGTLATDPDGDALTFTLVSGPAWASVSAAGVLTGTPGASAVGPNVFKVKVADNFGGEDITDVNVKVEHVNHPPKWTQDPIQMVATEDVLFNSNLKDFATDPDGDPLSFFKMTGPAWLTVNSDGSITGTPSKLNLGPNTFTVRVRDSFGAINAKDATLVITVAHVNHPPKWLEPVPMPAGAELAAYSFNLKPFATDPDNDPLSFVKKIGSRLDGGRS